MTSGELVFRGLRGRTLDDQAAAISSGYSSVMEMALDELGAIVLDLVKRMDRLESLYATYADADFRLPEGES